MKAKEIKKGIYWVGAVDWDLRNFHGYLTQKGSTYNAYLIVDEKITLIDTVKATVSEQLRERVQSVQMIEDAMQKVGFAMMSQQKKQYIPSEETLRQMGDEIEQELMKRK